MTRKSLAQMHNTTGKWRKMRLKTSSDLNGWKLSSELNECLCGPFNKYARDATKS